jgi:hypothetical protein
MRVSGRAYEIGRWRCLHPLSCQGVFAQGEAERVHPLQITEARHPPCAPAVQRGCASCWQCSPTPPSHIRGPLCSRRPHLVAIGLPCWSAVRVRLPFKSVVPTFKSIGNVSRQDRMILPVLSHFQRYFPEATLIHFCHWCAKQF